MEDRFSALNSPFAIGACTIKNRFVMAPVTTGSYLDPSGGFTQQGIDYFIRRAEGGFGLLQTGALGTDSEVDPYSALGGVFRTDPASFLSTSAEMLDRTRPFGAKFFVQLTAGLGRNYPGLPAPSAVDIFGAPGTLAPALTAEQVKRKIEQLVEASAIVKQAGYDGIEVHSIHWGYLLDQFALAITNHREDEYGGSLENRLRISTEICEGIKATCGSDFPVTMRLGLKSYIKGLNQGSFDGSDEAGRTLEEGVRICQLLEAAGYDALDVDTGTYDSFYYACPPMYVERGYMVELAERAKAAVGIPIICGSRMGDAFIDEEAVARGMFDAVALGRPMFADPDFPRKIEQGRPESIRPCIACNQGCLARLFNQLPAQCAVNPEVGHNADYRIAPASESKDVVIVGGGVAGMEAARVAALRGHDVVLLEKTDQLGGHLISGGRHAFKSEIRELNEWYRRELDELDVEMVLGVEATPEIIAEYEPDAIICALGSKPVMPKIYGADNPACVSCVDALNGAVEVGQNVVIVGGGLVGCEMALEHIKQGKSVTIVEMQPDILSTGIAVPLPNAMMLRDAFAFYGTPIMTGTKIAGVTDEGAVVVPTEGGDEQVIAADTVIIAVGFSSNEGMAARLKGLGATVNVIGDERGVGNIMTAIHDAYEVAHVL